MGQTEKSGLRVTLNQVTRLDLRAVNSEKSVANEKILPGRMLRSKPEQACVYTAIYPSGFR